MAKLKHGTNRLDGYIVFSRAVAEALRPLFCLIWLVIGLYKSRTTTLAGALA